MNISEIVGERIRAARERQQMTSTDLAKRIGMSRQLITNWEKGRRLPTLESIIALADSLNIPATFLLGVSDSLEVSNERRFSLKDLDAFHTNIDIENICVPYQFVDEKSDYIVVRMKDDSMADIFRKNDLAIIQLDQSIYDGNYVLFKINKTNQTLFRRYVMDNTSPANPQIKLVALNPSYPEICFDAKAITLIGICKDNVRMVG
ncbi:helix-turn-helix domain-containing protein [Legionella sp. W05-934-2]|jgi:transcriptional regulator with XRE-family HTH domain|uniref:helix-turn-helix domain-containing protein n=1 Tax=Legionella sp. W05-934-2 TaxID=1198649 RepID=UPI00346353CB